MGKGERTREMILSQAASLFNQRGYAASSMSEIMQVTGLEKGGIYNHFQSKDHLALEAFEYAVERIWERYASVLEGKLGALERLRAIPEVFVEMARDPVVAGGCPVMNAAIESDDAHPALRERVRLVMNTWRTQIRGIVEKGVSRGELRADTDGDALATVMISVLEGAVMLSRLYRDPRHIAQAVTFLEAHLQTLTTGEP
jgi:AcrR family transcriptional regulator